MNLVAVHVGETVYACRYRRQLQEFRSFDPHVYVDPLFVLIAFDQNDRICPLNASTKQTGSYDRPSVATLREHDTSAHVHMIPIDIHTPSGVTQSKPHFA